MTALGLAPKGTGELTVDVTFSMAVATVGDLLMLARVLADLHLPLDTKLGDQVDVDVSIDATHFELSHPSTLTVRLT